MQKNNSGFTLAESLITLFIVGILAAIAAPSFMGMYYRAQLNRGQNKVRGALQEAQRQAIRKSQSCHITLTNREIQNVSGASPCLLSHRDLPRNISLRSNVSSNVKFNFRGGTSSARTIVLSVEDNAIPDKKCIVISLGIGIMRSGNYTGTLDSISANDCKML